MNRIDPYTFSAEVRRRLPKPNRIMAPFQWYGGKGNLARWIVKYLPRGKVYVEPFAGAASVLFHLPQPYPVEILNDLDEEIVNLFRVLQDPEKFKRLAHMLTWTPYSLAEFRRALRITPENAKDDVELAWAFFVRQNQGFGGIAKSDGNWGRAFISDRDMAASTNRWRGRLHYLDWWHDRLTRVQIDCRDALEVIAYWDTPDTVFYLDPPYVPDTRVDKRVYKVEQDNEFHERLVELLLTVKGKVVLSGYPNPIYKQLEDAGWHRVERVTAAYAAGRGRGSKLRGPGAALKHARRIEALWISPNALQESVLKQKELLKAA